MERRIGPDDQLITLAEATRRLSEADAWHWFGKAIGPDLGLPAKAFPGLHHPEFCRKRFKKRAESAQARRRALSPEIPR